MNKTFCDRCRKDITKKKKIYKLSVDIYNQSHIEKTIKYDLCENCYLSLEHLMEGCAISAIPIPSDDDINFGYKAPFEG
jgi:hypothetical protein